MGSDIDIFAKNPLKVGRYISKTVKSLQEKNSSIKVLSYYEPINRCFHLFVYQNKKKYISFDVYGRLPFYKNITVESYLFEKTIDNAISINVSNYFNVKVATGKLDLLIRYCEYLEYSKTNPQKVKHLNYIKDKLSVDEFNMFRSYTTKYIQKNEKKGRKPLIDSLSLVYFKIRRKILLYNSTFLPT